MVFDWGRQGSTRSPPKPSTSPNSSSIFQKCRRTRWYMLAYLVVPGVQWYACSRYSVSSPKPTCVKKWTAGISWLMGQGARPPICFIRPRYEEQKNGGRHTVQMKPISDRLGQSICYPHFILRPVHEGPSWEKHKYVDMLCTVRSISAGPPKNSLLYRPACGAVVPISWFFENIPLPPFCRFGLFDGRRRWWFRRLLNDKNSAFLTYSGGYWNFCTDSTTRLFRLNFWHHTHFLIYPWKGTTSFCLVNQSTKKLICRYTMLTFLHKP